MIILSIANVDGSNEKEIASIRYPGVFYDPAWSPDGKMIACAAGNPNGVAEMYVAGLRVGAWAMKTISTRRWKWIGQMAWLADSRSLVMVAQENSASERQVWLLDSAYENPASGVSKLWVQPLDGGEPRLLAEFEADRIFGIDWSRGGDFLACVRGLWATNVALIRDFR